MGLLCFLLGTSVPLQAWAQVEGLTFERLSVEHGLPRSSVTSLLQDSRGFIWFGTMGGLCRYDGKTFKVYDPLYLPAESMILEDTRGALWYDPAGELHRLDAVTEKVTRYQIGSGSRTWRIFRDRSDETWVATRGDGLARYVPAADSFVVYTHEPGNPVSLCNDTVWVLFEDHSGNLWVGTEGGMDKLDRDNGKFVRCESVGGAAVRSILEDERSKLWLATDEGLVEFDAPSGSCRRYRGTGFQTNSILSIYLGRENELWLAGGGRIARFDRLTGRFVVMKASGFNSHVGPGASLLNNFLEDQQGRLWVATSAGLMLYERGRDMLLGVGAKPGDPRGITESDVTAMMEDRAGRVWIATGSGGVHMVDNARPPFVHIAQHSYDNIQLSHTFVGPVLEDRAGYLWVGSQHGLDRIDLSTGAKVHYNEGPNDKRSLPGGRILAIVEDGPDKLWVGTSGGLCLMDKQSGTFTPYIHRAEDAGLAASQEIMSLCLGRGGVLWLGGGSGSGLLMRFDRVRRRFTNYYHVGPPTATGALSNPIPSVYEDSSGVLWFSGKQVNIVGSDSSFVMRGSTTLTYEDPEGVLWAIVSDPQARAERSRLARLDRGSGNFLLVSDLKGLAGSTLFNLIGAGHRASHGQSGSGEIWLTTERGISRFDPVTGAIRNFGLSEGVPIAAADYIHAQFRNRDGYLYLGGTNGFVKFHPDSLRENQHIPPVVITSFKKFSTEAELDSTIVSKRLIELAYGENVISFEFAALDYSRPEKNEYAYTLEGFDKDWIYCGTRRSTTYTNLDPGSYIFRVKGSNNDGVWNEAGTSLVLIVHPPFWRTWWAYGLYVLVVLGLLYVALRFYHNRMLLKHEVEVKEVEARHFKEVSEIKSRFFANISHEFRTPLTLVLGPIRKWQERAHEEDERKDLSMAERNAQRLLRLINQLLDLSKLEAGRMQLRARRRNMVPLVRRIVASFETSACLRGIDLTVRLPKQEIPCYCDESILERILNNLLSNAMKFTPKGGRVEVTVREITRPGKDGRQGEFLELLVSDTGIGMAQHHLARVFDRFYQVDDSTTRAEGGTGIGLALVKELVELHHGIISVTSQIGAGTTFVVELPVGRELFEPEEILKQEEQKETQEDGNRPTPAGADDVVREGRAVHEYDGSEPLILIVDDNADVREYIADTLQGGYRMLEAVDGEDGVGRAVEAIPDLVISDVMMPKKNGYELCRVLKTDERTSHIPIILLTARAASESKLEGLETGADDYLIKPFEPKELQVRVKNLIESRRKLRERFTTSVPPKLGQLTVSSMDDAFLKKVMTLVEKHMGDGNFRTEELRAEIGLSRMQLHRKITALTNQSPGEFIRYLRLQRALEMLQKNAGTVSEIAYAVGFGDHSYFSKCFHRQFGKSPSEFKTNLARDGISSE